MSRRTSPPFRADHVGSLLRPALLRGRVPTSRQARSAPADLRAVEDEEIAKVIAMQEEIGLHVGDRRRVPPRVLAHGLHLRAGRGVQGPRDHGGEVPQRGGTRSSSPPAPIPDRRQGSGSPDTIFAEAFTFVRHARADRRPEADHPVAEHGALPRRAPSASIQRYTRTSSSSGTTWPPRMRRRCAGSANSAAPTCSSTTPASRT